MAVPHDLPHAADYYAETPEGGLGLTSWLRSGARTMPGAILFTALRTHGNSAGAASRPATTHLMCTRATAEIPADLRGVSI
jgi:hypothetical protein